MVDAVVLERRSARAAAASVGMSKSWAAVQVARYYAGGYEALAKRSTAPARRPTQISPALEDEVVALRKSLGELGTDAGAKTIGYHLSLLQLVFRRSKCRHRPETMVPLTRVPWPMNVPVIVYVKRPKETYRC